MGRELLCMQLIQNVMTHILCWFWLEYSTVAWAGVGLVLETVLVTQGCFSHYSPTLAKSQGLSCFSHNSTSIRLGGDKEL